MVVYSDSLFFDPETERIRSDGFTTFVTNHDSLSGYGFISTPDFKEWEIIKASGATWREIEPKNIKQGQDEKTTH